MGRLHSTISAQLCTREPADIEQRLLVARDPAERCDLLTELATLCGRTRPHDALRYYESALDEAERTGRKRLIAHALFRVGIAMNGRASAATILRYLEQARELYVRLRDRLRAAEVSGPIARIHADQGKPEQALRMLERNLRLFERAGEEIQIFDTLWLMSYILRSTSDIPAAIEAMHRAEELCRRRGDDFRLSLCHNEFGLLYRRIGDYDSALRHLFISLEIRSRSDEALQIGVALANIGSTYLLTKEPQQALPFLLKARDIYISIGERYREANVWNGLAEAHEMLDEPVEQKRCLTQAARLVAEKPRTDVAISIRTNLGRMLFRQRRYSQALRTLGAALDDAVQTGLANRELELRELLSSVHGEMGAHREAFQEYVRSVELRDTIMGMSVRRSIAEIETRFAVERKERELQQASSRVRELEEELRMQRLELTASTLRLMQRGTMIRKLSERMSSLVPEELRGRAGAEMLEEWSSVARRLPGADDGADAGLHERLLARCPALTPTELKVASLIGAGLASKEIASLLYVADRTVEIHRGNIRRKLGLTRKDSLPQILSRLSA